MKKKSNVHRFDEVFNAEARYHARYKMLENVFLRVVYADYTAEERCTGNKIFIKGQQMSSHDST